MVITDQAQFEQLVQEVRDQILSESQGVGEVDIVDNLDNIYSLPALKLNDSGDQVVEAPLSLLSAPAEEAAALARAAAYDANTAAESANSAASSANLATDKTNEAISNAQSATQRAESFADKANTAAQNADEATAQVLSGESERVEAENARQAAETERQSAEEARKSAEEARKLAEQSREQAESSRVSAEESRVTAESERVTAESSRVQVETERVQKESERESAEQTRQQNETTRQSNEDTRNQQEQTRQTNEEQRVSAESSRETEYTDLKQRADALIDDNEAAIENANTAAENANAAIANMENTYAKKDEIPDVSEFITTSVDNLVNYYRKSETYNQEQINSLIGSITTINFKIVDSLPGTGENNLIYLVPSSKQEEKNVKDEYIWIDGSWELIGSTKIDLSNYYTKDEVNSTFALKTELAWDTITGKPVWIGSSKPTYTWSEINGKPTTISGYGITDAYTKTESDDRYNIIQKSYASDISSNGSWYRIAESSAKNVGLNYGQFNITDIGTGSPCIIKMDASAVYDTEPILIICYCSQWNYKINKARIVYAKPYTNQKAYLELYIASGNTIFDYNVNFEGYGWKLIDPIQTSEDYTENLNSKKEISILNWSTNYPNKLFVNGNTVLHTGNYTSTLDTRYVKKSGDTMTGALTLPATTAYSHASLMFSNGSRIGTGTNDLGIYSAGDIIYIKTNSKDTIATTGLHLTASTFTFNNNKIWHSGNDGIGSGLDADLLDGYQGSSYDLVTDLSGIEAYGMYVIGLLQITDHTKYGNQARGRLIFTRKNGNNNVCTIFYDLSTAYNTTNVRFGYLMLGSGGNGISPCTFTYNGKKWAGFTMTNASNYVDGVQVMRVGLRIGERSTPFLLRYKTSNTETINNSEVNNSLVTNGSDLLETGVTTGTFYGNLSGNATTATTATRLQTPRTIWGQSFDGTNNINGDLITANDCNIKTQYVDFYAVDGSAAGYIGRGKSDNDNIIIRSYKNVDICINGRYTGIGTTSPSYKCHVEGTFYASGEATLGSTLTVNGDLIVKGTIIDSTSSDIRLKSILKRVDYQEKLLSLGDVVDFNYNDTAFSKENSSNLEHRSYTGLIYQNVKEILPQMAHEDDDGYGYLNYLSHDYINLIAGALQQTITKQKQLEKRISILEEENINLKQQLSN